MGGMAGMIQASCAKMTMADLAGTYDFELNWTGRAALEGRHRAADGNIITEPVGGLSMFDALQAQLGLKLESRKHPMPVIVVDHVERIPTDN